MSYLSTSGNVGFSGISPNLSDASCASQYKMAVGSVQSGEVTYMEDVSPDEHTYLTHINDYYPSKFKIDHNELYTFHDSDVIANEITVSHTEDSVVYNDCVDIKQEFDYVGKLLSNGEIPEVLPNGHYTTPTKSVKNTSNHPKAKIQNSAYKDCNQIAESKLAQVVALQTLSNSNNEAVHVADTRTSIISVNDKTSLPHNKNATETFLDVFKREQMGGVEMSNSKVDSSESTSTVPKTPNATSQKASSCKSSKSRRGRGPAHHEALQRIPPQRRAVAIPNKHWHAPKNELFDCGPLMERNSNPFQPYEARTSDDEDDMDGYGIWPSCGEETGVEDRGTRLELRRSMLRRQVALSNTETSDTSLDFARSLVSSIKKDLSKSGHSVGLSTYTVNHLLASKGLTTILSSKERRRLRASGWSRGPGPGGACGAGCGAAALPGARLCLPHAAAAPEQRLFAACAAVFAGGGRCNRPLLPLAAAADRAPLCAEHAWKRDNYDKISRECKPRKVVRKRVSPPNPRHPKRRRRPPAKPRPLNNSHTLTELNIGSNSSTYDSSEDTGIGGLSETEFIVSSNAHGLEVGDVGQVPPDDILDPAVLSQIPDEAFTEFFNQSEGGAAFVESEELTRALEAVLDERALDAIADCVLTSPTTKMPVSASIGVELSGAHS